MEEKIKDAIGQIRPFLQRDGGDINEVGSFTYFCVLCVSAIQSNVYG